VVGEEWKKGEEKRTWREVERKPCVSSETMFCCCTVLVFYTHRCGLCCVCMCLCALFELRSGRMLPPLVLFCISYVGFFLFHRKKKFGPLALTLFLLSGK